MERHAPDCPYPGCFFCVMKETNPSKRRANVAKFFKELPSQNEDGQVRLARSVQLKKNYSTFYIPWHWTWVYGFL